MSADARLRLTVLSDRRAHLAVVWDRLTPAQRHAETVEIERMAAGLRDATGSES